MSLTRYHAKRDFSKTAEPRGRAPGRAAPGASSRAAKPSRNLRFVIQKHAARRLHYDFRLELDGTLKSWAVPKGPSLDPADRRLAVHVEDHPVEYGSFEGVIPEKQYGAGEVIVWDQGTWAPISTDARKAYREGHLKFELVGEKLHGAWALVRMHGKRPGDEGHDNWLLIKEQDGEALPGKGEKMIRDRPESVISGRDVAELKGAGDADVWDSKESDPKKAYKPAKAAKATKAVKTAQATKIPTAKGAARKSLQSAAKAVKATGASERASKAQAARTDVKAALPAAFAGRKAALPAKLEPQLATLVEDAPQGEDWVYEVKFDGYRLLARVEKEKSGVRAKLFTRNGHDWSAKFPQIRKALEALPIDTGWLDGEVCVMNAKGVSSFSLLQQWLSDEGEGAKYEAVFMLFDLPYFQGRDLREVALCDRKALLAALLAQGGHQEVLRFSDHLDADGAGAQAQACKLGLEGLIGKRVDGAYINGRSRDWIKLKCRQRQEFVIAGYTPPQGARTGFGSLLLAVHEEGKLRYAGRVGTGFDARRLQSMLKELKALETDDSPFDAALPAAARVRGTRWVKPRLVAEVTFAEWTSDGHVRQAAFEGLREDKPARDIGAELPADARPARKTAVKNGGARQRPTKGNTTKSNTTKSNTTESSAAKKAVAKAPARKSAAKKAAIQTTRSGKVRASDGAGIDNEVAGLTISHPARLVFPEDGVTKLDVARFYERIAENLLPYVKDRPLSLVRCPDGIGGACFFQKHAAQLKLEGVERPLIEDSNGENPYIVVKNVEGLVSLAQVGNLELHAWNATMKNIEKPDMLVMDFDPAEDVPWNQVAEAAQAARTLFEALGLQSFLKTTGGKGLHVVVPFTPKDGWDEVKAFSHHIALRMVEAFPDRFLATATKAKRKGKIFVDYLRNGRGATAVSPYTLRARPGATVAVPLDWKDLKRDWRSKPVTIEDILGARGRIADPWKDYFKVRQSITEKMKRSIGMK
jgi:bifunctional non-homologous end joining protein LigD